MKAPEVALKDRREAVGSEFTVDDWLWVKVFALKAGEMIEQHTHCFDHVTLIATGTVRKWINGQDCGEITGPKPITIAAMTEHKFLAITDAVVGCIHNLRGEGYPAILED